MKRLRSCGRNSRGRAGVLALAVTWAAPGLAQEPPEASLPGPVAPGDTTAALGAPVVPRDTTAPGGSVVPGQQTVALGGVPLEGGVVSHAAVSAALSNQVLYLQTFVNGVDSGVISPYRLIGGALYGDAYELRQLGFRIDDKWVDGNGLVEMSQIPGLVYRLDTLKQTIEVTVGAEQLEGHQYDAGAERLQPAVSPGAVLNYDIYGQSTTPSDPAAQSSSLLSGLLDLRAFASPGTFTQTGIVRYADPQPSGDYGSTIRLDSTLFHSDADRLQTYRVGDLISGASLPWATPVRLGGVQWQRNFRLQPNLVTFPVPTVAGSAAVPSTVDVFVNNVQQYSRGVDPGPFAIDNMPVITGQGEIRVVVRDALGREQVTTLPFYAAANLLRPGFVDWSVEAGYLRRNYAIESNDYEAHPAGIGSVRAGVTNWLTLEGHTEDVSSLQNGGVGAVARVGLLGVVSGSYSASRNTGTQSYSNQAGTQSYSYPGSGSQWSAAYQFFARGVSLSASTREATPSYATLATFGTGTAPARRTSQASLSGAVAGGGLSLSYVEVQGGGLIAPVGSGVGGGGGGAGSGGLLLAPASSSTTRIGTLAYSVTLRGAWSLNASVFRDFSAASTGGGLGLTHFFGTRTSASLGAQYRGSSDGTVATLQASQTLPAEGTGGGWRVQAASDRSGNGSAAIGYRFNEATAEAGAAADNTQASEFVSLRGSVVGMDWRRWPMLTNPIRESFALVDTVVPDVTVMYENRAIGRSDDRGLLLIPNLTAQSRNQIAIDPRDVPLDAEIGQVHEVAVPLDRSGVLVKFPVTFADAALVTLVRADGKPVPMGASVTVAAAGGAGAGGSPGAGGAEPYVVGYDGQAYVKHLAARSVLDVAWAGGSCRAEVAYRREAGTEQRIGPITCD